MARNNYQRILVKQKGKYYYLFNIKLSNSDGSLYIAFPRKGISCQYNKIGVKKNRLIDIFPKNVEIPKTKSISYHTSGFIHYKNLSTKNIYGEPIFEITQLFTFIHYSIPKISLLDELSEKLDSSDHIIEAPPEANLRNTFSVSIAPEDIKLEKASDFGITFKGLFNILILINSVVVRLPKKLDRHFIHLMPSKGLFDKQKYPQPESQLFFHQKINQIQDVIIYRPNGEGVYKMFFAVPMRIIPRVKIDFSDPNLTAIILEDKSRTNTTLNFKVKDRKNNFVKEQKKIVNVELDAEL